MTLNDFYSRVEERQSKTKERWGQAAFNILSETNPELAEKIRGSDMDPFYAEFNTQTIGRFLAFLDKNFPIINQ